MKTALRQAGAILGLALLPALGAAFLHPKKPAWDAPQKDEVPLSAVANWGSTVLWVDARPRSEYQRDHIPGALLLNQAEWDSLIVPVLEAWTPERVVVVYC